MTAKKNKKRLVRSRMAKTGESYQSAERKISAPAVSEAKPRFALHYLAHVLELDDKPFTIGRFARCNLQLDDALVSRIHATIQVIDGDRVEITDHESRNGVLVNGRRITKSAELSSGDVILIGTSSMNLEGGSNAPRVARPSAEIGSVLAARFRLLRKASPPQAAALYSEAGTSDCPWEVYDVEHVLLGGAMTVKVLRTEASRANPLLRVFLLREGRALQRATHPQIIKVFDIAETPSGETYLVLEGIPDKALSLRDYSNKTEKVDAAVIREIVVQLARILEHVHQRGVLHRGIHDAAIFVEQGKEITVKLTDFAFATIEGDPPIAAKDAALGYPAFMSPEQTSTRAVDARSDLYSVGVVLYQLLARRLPFQADTPAAVLELQRTATPPPLTGSPLHAICMKLLAKAPGDRYANATALLEALTYH